MKKLVRDYIFSASTQTVTSADFTSLKKIFLITNVVSGTVIYDGGDSTVLGTLAAETLTLAYDTTTMNDTDELQIIVEETTDLDRIGFSKAIVGGVDTEFFNLINTGSGQTVNQTGGNLVLTTGTTARAETIIRSNNRYTGGIRFRSQTILSQRIINQQFFVELVDLVGDGLTYTINSATSITVTFPTGHGLTSENVGQFISVGNFSGTGTFFSGRYAIASVSEDNISFTVAAFAVGTGTCSAFGRSFYRLEYSGATATSAFFDTGRSGFSLGNTTATISTTASPGHQVIGIMNDGIATLADQLIASSATIQTTTRANRVTMVPDDQQLYLQVRFVNGTTAPATNTTWTIGQLSIGKFEAESVIIQDIRLTNNNTAIPVELMRGVATATQPVSGTVTATVTNATVQPSVPTTPYFLNSAASTNLALIITGTSGVFSIYATNIGATTAFVKLYNKATAPVLASDIPEIIIPVPAAVSGFPGVANVPAGFIGYRFALGLGIAITGAVADTDTTAVAAGQVKVKLSRTT